MSLELVLVVPLVLTMMMVIMQLAVIYHANNVVEAAAREGLSAARTESGTAEDGRAAALQFIGEAADNFLSSESAQVDRPLDGDQAEVTVRAQAISLLPGVNFEVEGRAVGPIERFRDADE